MKKLPSPYARRTKSHKLAQMNFLKCNHLNYFKNRCKYVSVKRIRIQAKLYGSHQIFEEFMWNRGKLLWINLR